MEAFDEWVFRSDGQPENSWVTLAEMAHYGAVTRLLDWTEVFSIALYFALEKYYQCLYPFWQSQGGFGHTPASVAEVKAFHKARFGQEVTFPEPSLWVLNPYRLGQVVEPKLHQIRAVGNGIYPDYYKDLVIRQQWNWDLPIPAYSPWHSARLAAQRGTFLIYGKSRVPLDLMLSADSSIWETHLGRPKPDSVSTAIVKRICIPASAALYGTRFLVEYVGIDRFSLFRDREALASRINADFFSARAQGRDPMTSDSGSERDRRAADQSEP
jgi:hypothetical protein